MENGKSNSREFTFRQLATLIKKSALRILIFCLIAGVLTGSIGLIAYFTGKDKNVTVSAVIDINIKGIEESRGPNTQDFDITKAKSPQIVKKAIDEVNAEQNAGIDVSKQDKIINNIKIESVIPDDILQKILIIRDIATKTPSALVELNDIHYTPTRFKLSIVNLKAIGISKSQARVLLDEIIKQYTVQFKDFYSTQQLLVSDMPKMRDVQETSKTYDYIELYDLYDTEISIAVSYLNTKSSEAPTFRSGKNGKSFIDLRKSLDIVKTLDLNKYRSFVLQNSVSEDRDLLLHYYTMQKEQKEKELAQEQEAEAKMKDIIESYKNGDIIIPTDGGATTAIGGPTEQYDKLFNLHLEKIRQIQNLNKQIDKLDVVIDAFDNEHYQPEKNTQDNRDEASEKIENIAIRLQEIIAEANEIISEYYDVEYFNDAIGIAVGATYQSQQNNTIKVILLVLVMVELVAVVVAVYITYLSLKKKGITLE